MTDLLGMAVGVAGISLPDFRQLTPGELEAALRAHREREELRRRDDWERMRLLAVMVMQPHCRKRLSPGKLLPFPWERKERVGAAIPDKETARRRFEDLVRRSGQKI